MILHVSVLGSKEMNTIWFVYLIITMLSTDSKNMKSENKYMQHNQLCYSVWLVELSFVII